MALPVPRAVALGLVATLAAGGARADVDVEAGDDEAHDAPTYEEERTARLLDREGLRPARDPDGRRVAFIRIVREDVFVDDEAVPTWPNAFHWLTGEAVVSREVLLTVGAPYERALAQETMRNLRDLGVFSLVRVVPVEVPEPGAVGVIVHTRDLWSLRFEQAFQVTGSQIDELLLQLTERNLFGRQKQLVGRVFLYPLTVQLGQVYVDRRIAGARLRFVEAADVIFSRDTGRAEGFSLGATLESPFYELSQRLGFSLDAVWEDLVARHVQGGAVVRYDDPETAAREEIQEAWAQRYVRATALGLVRRGTRTKQTFGVGFRFDELAAEPTADAPVPAEHLAAWRRDVPPRARRQLGPLVRYQLFLPEYSVFENLSTFGQSEDVRVGPTLEATIRTPLRALGSSSTSVLFEGELREVLALGGGLLEGSVTLSTRLEDRRAVDQRLRLELRGATPFVGPLRVVARGTWQRLERDTTNALVALGGESGLRGFPSQAFYGRGADLLRVNVELRTRPLVWQAVHLGLVAFYDVGAVYERADDFALHHAAGVGLRVLFAQLNRFVYRADLGASLDREFALVPSFGGAQAVPLTATEDALLQ